MNAEPLSPAIAAAYREAKARGLPDGWTCSIDKRNRRKWTAPNNGRSCDSIPKALTISVELGLLPPDTVIESGKRKRKATDKAMAEKTKKKRKMMEKPHEPKNVSGDRANEDEEEEEEEEEEDETPPEPLDPEITLNGASRRGLAATFPYTVHWDPSSPDGQKIGWKIRVSPRGTTNKWIDGRVVRYDPYSHKHKIELQSNGEKSEAWIWLRNEEHNLHLATRMVWAHVKGYAWWPALVMESNSPDDRKEGYVFVEFFGSGEVSTLRDSDESIRPFSPFEIDPVVAKHKKKRNARAYQLACEEYNAVYLTRFEAAMFYAKKAVAMANQRGNTWIGKRVQVFRSDVNYPYGDTVIGAVRQYSAIQKKWLLSFEISDKTGAKYDSCWLNLQAKECAVKSINRSSGALTIEDLLPYLRGIDSKTLESPKVAEVYPDLTEMFEDRCRGCIEYLKKDDVLIHCEECSGSFHLGCFDPPLSVESWQRAKKDGTKILCSRCTPCRGCYQKDLVFGSHVHPLPHMLSFPPNEPLTLCSMCQDAYDSQRFCPNCAHTWDDTKYQKVRKQIEWAGGKGKKRRTGFFVVEDTGVPAIGSFSGDDVLPLGASVDPQWYYPETSEWGYTEIDMLVCDSCKVWVHAGCSGISEDDYDLTSDGDHPIYSKEFLCRACCRKRSKELIEALEEEDKSFLFAVPVTEKVAPNYHDVIKNPMDLQTMLKKAENEEYLNYAWVRECFELIVLNALTFNRYYTKIWIEAKRFYHDGIKNVFLKRGKGAPAGKYDNAIKENFKLAEEARKLEADRVQVDESVEKKDLVAGSMAATVKLPELRSSPPDQSSCVPFSVVQMKPIDAFYCSWLDACFSCGSSGASDTMLFCVDCGEAFHSFCVNAPIHSMDQCSVAGWRCPNCKICEISGDVPQDETRMLFCEMCDRAFSLDLIDPPLSSAPTGLWICGQCVECKVCQNKSEPKGPSLCHWSRDPEKCYRCGGCEGLVDSYASENMCAVCKKLLRADDEDIIQCSKCHSNVHTGCDVSAAKLMAERANESRKGNEKIAQYECPECTGIAPTKTIESLFIDRMFLLECLDSVTKGMVGDALPDFDVNHLPAMLLEKVDWEIRRLWRDDYVSMISDAIRVAATTKRSFGDPRVVIQHARNTLPDLPSWKAERALRFLVQAKRFNFENLDFSGRSIEFLVLTAKLAAAFIDVVCRTVGVESRSDVSSVDRMDLLLRAPDSNGFFELPVDKLTAADNIEIYSIPLTEDAVKAMEKTLSAVVSNQDAEEPVRSISLLAQPLRGWDHVASSLGGSRTKWKDPRECCLCHLCGDDEAGLPDEYAPNVTPPDGRLTPLGRLLPMPDCYWVHTACALWSSEVWETSSDGLVHAAEKARGRGAQLKCFGCGHHGATVGCNKSNCPYNYHFPCAKACGAVFTTNQHVYCINHKSAALSTMPRESFEYMKSLTIAPEKKNPIDKDLSESKIECCPRIGTLVVHTLGKIETETDGFHSENYITPPGYIASRIFWSTRSPRTRTVYILRVERNAAGSAEFSITPGDHPAGKITGSSVAQVYNILLDRVRKANSKYFSLGDMYSRLPVVRRTRRKTFGLNGPQFFGFGLNHVRKLLEQSQDVEAVVAPLTPASPSYRFCYVQPELEAVLDLQRKRAAAKAERALMNTSGCARTEGMTAVSRSGGSGRITRALVRSAEEELPDLPTSAARKGDEKAQSDRNMTQVKYRKMNAVPIEQRLAARRSHIHGWGLFTKLDIAKHDPIVEYMGEIIRQPIADKRERAYEISGEGSCYMFRLDMQRIVDATMIGCMARFMNHSCQPNAYAKIISIDTEQGQDKKIVVFAERDISAGEEITYDYKFPVEDGSLRCTCGAPNCIGRLN